ANFLTHVSFPFSSGARVLSVFQPSSTYLASGSDVAGSRLFFASSDFVLLASGVSGLCRNLKYGIFISIIPLAK
ncbi:hypothetical protein CH063_07361, partial [Colletotrichum higginsianum]